MNPVLFTGAPSDTAPYLNLFKSLPGVPEEPIGIYPKLISRPKKMRFTDDGSIMALLTDVRRETLAGIGSSSENAPTEGIRVFNRNGRFLFLGGSPGQAPRLYERTGPVFQNTQLLPLPALGVYAQHAVFSLGGRWLFIVWSDAPDTVLAYQWSGADAEDPTGAWAFFSYIAIGQTVTQLRMTPLGTYLLAGWPDGTKVIEIESSPALTAIADPPAAVVDVAADESIWLLRTPVAMTLYTYAAAVWTAGNTLAGSGFGYSDRALFAPNGEEILLARSGVSSSPATFVKNSDGTWSQTYAEAHATSGTLRDMVFRDDGQQAVVALGGSLEVYNREVVVPPPLSAFTVSALTDISRTRVASSADGSAIVAGNSGSNGTTIFDDTGTNLIARASGDGAVGTTFNDIALSADGQVLFATVSTGLFMRRGSVARTFALSGVGTLGAINLSPDGQFIGIVASDSSGTSVLRIYRYDATGTTASAWTLTFVTSASMIATDGDYRRKRPQFSPSNDMILVPGYSGNRERIFSFDGTVLTVVTNPALPANFASNYFGPVWLHGGERFVMAARRTSGATGYKLLIYGRTGTTFTFETELDAGSAQIIDIAVRPDGNAIAAVAASAVTVYAASESGWVSSPPPALTVTSGQGVAWSDNFFVLTSASSKAYAWDFGAQVAFKKVQEFAATAPDIWGYSPQNQILHFGSAAQPRHVQTSDWSDVTLLTFASDRLPGQVWSVLYSPDRAAVVFLSPDGLEAGTRKGQAGDFVNSKDIQGTFVTLYDFQDGLARFRERDYAVHIIGANVFDMVYGANDQVFSYHVFLPPEAPNDAEEGRLLYDIASPVSEPARFDFRGQVYDPGVTRSFIAFSPYGTHFVVTLERDTTNNSIVLAKFLDNYYFDETDEEPVQFGPPAFSYCDDVVVAHGGADPFTFFKHNTTAETLGLQAKPISNWSYTGVILDIEFNDTCDGMVVLTPEEIIPIEVSEDAVTGGEGTGLDQPIEDDEQDDTDMSTGGGAIVVSPPMPSPGWPGNYQDDGGISGINYVPYVTVTVSFKVKPVPKP